MATSRSGNTEASQDSHVAWWLAILAPISALAVLRPWTKSAFPVWDYDDMLPIFRASHGVWSALTALGQFTRQDGRANYLTYLDLAVTWRIVGDNPVGWQWQRAILMLAAAMLFVVVARRLGARPISAALAALVFTLAVPSTEGWLFIMGEPLAVIFLLLIILTGYGYRTAADWGWRAVAIGLLALAVMMTKEVLGICLPIVIGFVVCWVPGEGLKFPAFGRRERHLAMILLVVIIAEGWSARTALAAARPGAYATAFARDGVSAGQTGTLLQAMLLPARFTSAAWQSDLYPANLAFVAVLILGALLSLNASRAVRMQLWQAGIVMLSFPVLGAVTYALWPRYSAFYGIPFFAASTGLFALAGTQIERAHSGGRWVVAVIGMAALAYTATVAARTASYKRAVADIAAIIVRGLVRQPHLDSILVVTPRQGGRLWPISASELSRYARALQVPDSVIPAMQDASCEAVAARLHQPLRTTGILNDMNPCGRLPSTTRRWVAPTRYLDWSSLATHHDTVAVEILAPAWSAPVNPPH